MSDQPKPTGEWTLVPCALHFNVMCGETVIYEGVTSEMQGRALVDAHKSELAAERELAKQAGNANIRTNEMLTNVRRERDEAQKQLAAEREKVRALVEMLEQVLSETVDARDYPDGPCLNASTRSEIKDELEKSKEGKPISSQDTTSCA